MKQMEMDWVLSGVFFGVLIVAVVLVLLTFYRG